MYALSTMAMNHRGWFEQYYDGHVMEWEPPVEERFGVEITESTTRRDVANTILVHLGIEGAHGVRGRLDRTIRITRDNPWDTRRISYTPADSLLSWERRVSRAPAILESLHRRRGYQHAIWSEDVWGFSVDLVIVAMMFWAGSGVWMWWEMPVTRRLGGIAIGVSFVLYAFFLVMI